MSKRIVPIRVLANPGSTRIHVKDNAAGRWLIHIALKMADEAKARSRRGK